MPSTPYVAFAPSHRDAPSAKRTGDVAPDEQIEISLYLKPRDEKSTGIISRDDLVAQRSKAHKGDIQSVKTFAKNAGLKVTAVEPGRRLIKLAGSAETMQKVFQTELGHYQDGKQEFRGRSGMLHLPKDLSPIVEAVLGLDTRPAAQPRLVKHPEVAAASSSFLPNQVAQFYGVPAGLTGAGECIALIELGGGFSPADTTAAFEALGISAPKVVSVSVDKGVNKPKPDDGADGEVALDIQVAGGIAHGAKIAVYFSPNTDAGFVDAITGAAHDTTNKPSIMSISWGSAEANWTAQGLAAMTSALQDAATLGLSVFVAAGDNLATDGVSDGKAHVDFPASSPWAIGCGGTFITVKGNKVSRETVWNRGTSGTGGGISDVYPVPTFQLNAHLPVSYNGGRKGRGVPDVACVADPNSGYIIVVSGQREVVGGTSAVAPFWAGLTALANQKGGKPAGFFLPFLYDNAKLLRDITSGNNKPTGSPIGYSSGSGWDACTGLGVPNGQAIINALSANKSAVEALS
jgi:kumamolisin